MPSSRATAVVISEYLPTTPRRQTDRQTHMSQDSAPICLARRRRGMLLTEGAPYIQHRGAPSSVKSCRIFTWMGGGTADYQQQHASALLVRATFRRNRLEPRYYRNRSTLKEGDLFFSNKSAVHVHGIGVKTKLRTKSREDAIIPLFSLQLSWRSRQSSGAVRRYE